MELTTLWFILIAVLWIGYFTLEGFDMGVGTLLPVLGKDEVRRRQMLASIGPHWDGNEVWLLTAGGATFAAFPHWYATLFSGFYLPLLLILVALICRGIGLEYRGKKDGASWKSKMDAMVIFGSFLPALLWGVAFANIVRGVKIDSEMEYVGSFWDLLNPVALLGGLMTLTVFLTHGAIFTALKTADDLRVDARNLAVKLGLVAAVLVVLFMIIMLIDRDGGVAAWIAFALAAVAWLGGLFFTRQGSEGKGFAGTFVAIALVVASLFLILFPDVMPTTLSDGVSLTKDNAASTPLTLKIMTGAALVFTPIVLAYQAWTYWIFRKRISRHHIPGAPADATPQGPVAADTGR